MYCIIMMIIKMPKPVGYSVAWPWPLGIDQRGVD